MFHDYFVAEKKLTVIRDVGGTSRQERQLCHASR